MNNSQNYYVTFVNFKNKMGKNFRDIRLVMFYWAQKEMIYKISTKAVLQTRIERDRNTRPPDLPLEKPVCRSGSNS